MPDPNSTRGEASPDVVQPTVSGQVGEPATYRSMCLVDFFLVTTLAVAVCGAAMAVA
ncbi:MAG: hypothetical protein AB7F89_27480 [Pirellulaceae bacterium]